MSVLHKYKILKELGNGMNGTTYLASHNNKKYALKIEKIFEKDIKKSTSSPTWREIEFCKYMNKKYPDQFLTLYEHEIINNCEHEQKFSIDIKTFKKSVQNTLIEKNKSTFCSVKVYSLVDTTLRKLKDNLTDKEAMSIMVQVANIVYILHEHGYTHNDLHLDNIGVKYTDKKYITILGKQVPTYGRLIQPIQ